jgi:cell division septum initiation protein DivIVA
MQVVEEQISALLAEQQQLRHRIAELESRLARYERASRPDGASHREESPAF